jgi:hypothetical protein
MDLNITGENKLIIRATVGENSRFRRKTAASAPLAPALPQPNGWVRSFTPDISTLRVFAIPSDLLFYGY